MLLFYIRKTKAKNDIKIEIQFEPNPTFKEEFLEFMREIMFRNREKEIGAPSDKFNSPQKVITREEETFRKR